MRCSICLSLACTLFSISIAMPVMADVIKPVIPQANGKQCVEETGFMRRNHMDLLSHQRNITVHKGVRTKKHSLQGCLNCHAVFEKGIAVDIKSKKHFCNSCHNYVAVKIDCFDCHNSKPKPAQLTRLMLENSRVANDAR